MLGKITSAFIGLSLLISPVYANTCIDQIEKHQEYSTMDLNHCFLQDDDLPQVIAYLQRHPNIQELLLGDNYIGAQGAKLLRKIPTAVKVLDMGDNPLHDEGISQLAKIASLNRLEVYSTEMTAKGARAIAKNKNIHTLNVANNPIRNSGLKALLESGHITELFAVHNWITNAGLAYIKRNAQLELLFIGMDNFNGSGIAELSQNTSIAALGIVNKRLAAADIAPLTKMKNLVEIYFAFDGFNDDISEILVNSRIQNIVLDDNHITDQGAMILAAKPNLYYLSLENNDISDPGAIALTSNKNLRDLDLSYNKITDEGAFALAKTNTLEYLDVSNNLIGEAGIKALEANPTIIFLGTEGNPGSKHVKKKQFSMWKLRYWARDFGKLKRQ